MVRPTGDSDVRINRENLGKGHKKELEARDVPPDTQPISIGYESARNNGSQPPAVPEPNTFALMSVGLASYLVYNRRKKS